MSTIPGVSVDRGFVVTTEVVLPHVQLESPLLAQCGTLSFTTPLLVKEGTLT